MDSTKCFRIEKDAQIPFNNKVDYLSLIHISISTATGLKWPASHRL